MGELRGYDRYLTHIESIVRRLNLHLPKNRKTLSQLLGETEPSVNTVEGDKICFKKQDIEEIARVVPQRYHRSLMLPILVVRRIDLGKGAFVVLGGRTEKSLVKKVLGLSEKSFDELCYEDADLHIYRPQVQELLAKLKSAVTIGFDVPDKFGR
jgi:uncharacterized protein (UPF0216 family)